jgi:hypothetical protein
MIGGAFGTLGASPGGASGGRSGACGRAFSVGLGGGGGIRFSWLGVGFFL